MPMAIAAACMGLLGFLFGVRELTKYLQHVTAPADSILKTPHPQKTNSIATQPPASQVPQRSDSEFFM